MNRIVSYLLLSAVLLLGLAPVAACDSEVDDFAIYLVADVDPQDIYALKIPPLSELKLAEKPVLTLDDIDYYDFPSHYIFLKEVPRALEEATGKSLAVPFVAVAGGQRCYLGYFVSWVSSYLPHGPYITYPSFRAGDVIAVENSVQEGEADLRDDPRIINVLSRAGKLNAGLRVSLTGVEVSECAGTGVVTYSFTITNNNGSPLYVPDPDKMGSGLFHYYTNGLGLTASGSTHVQFWASNKPQITVDPTGRWEAGWFTGLGAGETINRTVVLTGYPVIPSGAYTCRFTYSGPGKIQKTDRAMNDGTIWIGEVASAS
jgi:hypothetical protein